MSWRMASRICLSDGFHPGCPDGEDWQRLPCTNGKATLIDPNCHNALTGKSLFGGE
jgi:hypothetical protein